MMWSVTDQAPFANYQYEIYLAGMADQRPELPYFSPADWEQAFREAATPEAHGYVAGAAGAEDTLRENLEAFRRWRLVPRMLRDISVRDTRTELFGAELHSPLLLAPVGVQAIVHPDGELATARAAASLDVPMVHSTAASTSIEDVAAALGDTPRWFQLYWPNDPEMAASFVRRAEAAGYGAIVLTLDTFMLAWRPRDLRTAYLPFLKGIGIANYLTDPVFRGALEKPPEEDLQAAIARWALTFSDPTVTWDRLGFLREHTGLPILLKGILHPQDARKAVEHGIDGLIVSNHGGRQVDGAIAALDALPDVISAVPEDYPVLFDSGIRTGADVVKALALGARAVLLGRPYIWGLGVAGEEGVRQVVRSLLAEIDLTLGLSGLTALDQVSSDILVRPER
jgi:isopentenyl diphosphate isomerase/L-lactate dehydrogenase-like FMN-dependent dehydrogenase